MDHTMMGTLASKLSPATERARPFLPLSPEIKETADKHLAMIRARAGACRRISIARAAILQSLEAAEDAGLWAAGFETLHTRLEALALPRRHSRLTLAEAEHFADRLAALQTEARALFEVAALNGSTVIEVGAGAIPRELAERVSPREPLDMVSASAVGRVSGWGARVRSSG